MPQNDILRRYTEAGISFTRLTRSRAQEIVKDLVKTGEIQRKQAQKQVDELLDRSRKSTEELMDVIRREVRKQVGQLRFVTRDDVQKLLDRFATSSPLGQRIAGVSKSRPSAKTAGKKAAPAKKAGAKKSPAKKAGAKKAVAKKSAPPRTAPKPSA